MTVQEMLLYLNFALGAIALLGHAKGFFSSGEKALLSAIASLNETTKALSDTLQNHEKRIGSIEGEMKHLPTRESQHNIELKMGEISKDIAVLTESLKPIKANGELLADLLREQVKGNREAA